MCTYEQFYSRLRSDLTHALDGQIEDGANQTGRIALVAQPAIPKGHDLVTDHVLDLVQNLRGRGPLHRLDSPLFDSDNITLIPEASRYADELSSGLLSVSDDVFSVTAVLPGAVSEDEFGVLIDVGTVMHSVTGFHELVHGFATKIFNSDDEWNIGVHLTGMGGASADHHGTPITFVRDLYVRQTTVFPHKTSNLAASIQKLMRGFLRGAGLEGISLCDLMRDCPGYEADFEAVGLAPCGRSA